MFFVFAANKESCFAQLRHFEAFSLHGSLEEKPKENAKSVNFEDWGWLGVGVGVRIWWLLSPASSHPLASNRLLLRRRTLEE